MSVDVKALRSDGVRVYQRGGNRVQVKNPSSLMRFISGDGRSEQSPGARYPHLPRFLIEFRNQEGHGCAARQDGAFRKAFRGERVEFLATFIRAGGKMGDPKPTDSAFLWRAAAYHMYLTIAWEDKWMQKDGGIPQACQERAATLCAWRCGRFHQLSRPSTKGADPREGVPWRNRRELRRIKKMHKLSWQLKAAPSPEIDDELERMLGRGMMLLQLNVNQAAPLGADDVDAQLSDSSDEGNFNSADDDDDDKEVLANI
ncbi:hypothetical protein BKA62DRAFT_670311 [Auriculariales sp. MPI-PUGE-AT-0066]|nr:hypothetical protein BKA62DRAFT_670311 [Auriculariales sp. MPI-PUGE-AT-0066]